MTDLDLKRETVGQINTKFIILIKFSGSKHDFSSSRGNSIFTYASQNTKNTNIKRNKISDKSINLNGSTPTDYNNVQK